MCRYCLLFNKVINATWERDPHLRPTAVVLVEALRAVRSMLYDLEIGSESDGWGRSGDKNAEERRRASCASLRRSIDEIVLTDGVRPIALSLSSPKRTFTEYTIE